MLLWTAAVAAAWLTLWRSRVFSPYPLEWQETVMFEHAARVLAGAPIYVRPDVDFAPFPYPPLFHWIGAGAIAVLGPALSSLRIVSVVSTAAVLVLLVRLGTQGHRSRPGGVAERLGAGLVGALIFGVGYLVSGRWFDVARVDMLATALGAAAIVVLDRAEAGAGTSGPPRALRAGVLAGVLLAAATLAKQTMLGLALGLPVVLLLVPRCRAAALAALLSCVLLLVGCGSWLEARSDGWFLFTTVDLLAGSPWHAPAILGFWVDVAPLLAVPGLLWGLAGCPRPTSAVAAGAAALLLLTAWIARAHEGGYDNTLIPAALAAAIMASGCWRGARRARAVVVLGACSAILAWPLSREMRSGSPHVAAQAAAAGAIAAMAEPVWQPGGTLDPARPGGVHRMAILDLLKSREADEAQRFVRRLEAALDGHYFRTIVLANDLSEWGALAPAIARNYEVVEELDGATWPPTGAPIGPRTILAPR